MTATRYNTRVARREGISAFMDEFCTISSLGVGAAVTVSNLKNPLSFADDHPLQQVLPPETLAFFGSYGGGVLAYGILATAVPLAIQHCYPNEHEKQDRSVYHITDEQKDAHRVRGALAGFFVSAAMAYGMMGLNNPDMKLPIVQTVQTAASDGWDFMTRPTTEPMPSPFITYGSHTAFRPANIAFAKAESREFTPTP